MNLIDRKVKESFHEQLREGYSESEFAYAVFIHGIQSFMDGEGSAAEFKTGQLVEDDIHYPDLILDILDDLSRISEGSDKPDIKSALMERGLQSYRQK